LDIPLVFCESSAVFLYLWHAEFIFFSKQKKIVIDICPLLCIIKLVTGICRKQKEVKNMPGRDGTGPLGAGAGTGKGFGPCVGAVKYGAGLGLGLGLACRRGFGRGFGRGLTGNRSTSPTRKELLQEQRSALQSRLEEIDKQLEII
jgi:hypothetical protein